MAARIKFNPVTKEVEIEGTEKFVETHFKRIEKILSPPKEKVKERPSRVSKKAERLVKRPVRKGLKRGEIFNTVVAIIRESGEGVTTGELVKKTGFTQQQVRTVIFKAEKDSVIQRSKRGTYVIAGSTTS